MPKAYWVSHIDVQDPNKFATYATAAVAAFTKYNGRLLVRGGRYQSLEGGSKTRNVIIEFDSMEEALHCYESEEYQHAKAYRENAAEMDMMIVEGIAEITD